MKYIILLVLFIGCTMDAELSEDFPKGWWVCEPHDPTWNSYRFYSTTLSVRRGIGTPHTLSFTTEGGKNVTLNGNDPYICNPEVIDGERNK